MALIKYATKEITAKIVYYGPGLSGKTTNLQYINQKKPGGKCGELLSLATEGDRTLFFDLLPMNVGMIAGFRLRFQLFTVPGQIFYNKTRKMVLRDADGVVFVADSQAAMRDRNVESLENLKDNLRENGLDYEAIPFVLQFNKRDLPNTMPGEEMSRDLNDKNAMYFDAVATTGEGVLETLQHLMKLVLFDLDKKYNIYKPRVRESDEERKPAPAEVPSQPAAAATPIPPPRPVVPLHRPGSPAPSPMGPSSPAVRPPAVAVAPAAATVGTATPASPFRPPPPVRPITRPAGPPEGWDLTARVREGMEEPADEEETLPEEVEAVTAQPVPMAGEPDDEEVVEDAEPVEEETEPEEEEGEGDRGEEEELEPEAPVETVEEQEEAEEAGAEVAGDLEAGTEEAEEEEEEIQDLTDAVPVEELTGARAEETTQPVPPPAPHAAVPRAAPEAEPSPPVVAAAPASVPAIPAPPLAGPPALASATDLTTLDGARLARLEEAYRDISAKIDEFMMEFRDAFVEGKITRDKDKRDLFQAIFELRQTPDMMTAREVAKYLNVSSGAIYQLAKEGKIPCTRLEGRRKWIFPKALVDEWIIRKTKEE